MEKHKAFPSSESLLELYAITVWLRNIKLKWDKSAARRAASNPATHFPRSVLARLHHSALLFSMTMCQIWAFWKQFPYAISGSLLSHRERERERERERRKTECFKPKGTDLKYILFLLCGACLFFFQSFGDWRRWFGVFFIDCLFIGGCCRMVFETLYEKVEKVDVICPCCRN